MADLTEFHKDAIAELLNIGMGSAAASLSEMVGEEVGLSVPGVNFFPREEAVEYLVNAVGDEVSVVRERFDGVFWGDAVLLFPAEKSQKLLNALLGENAYTPDMLAELTPEMMAELEQEGMTEVGNIILNACMGSLANIFGQNLSYHLPQFSKGLCAEVLAASSDSSSDDQGVLLLHMDFLLKETQINGYLTLLMDVNSMRALTQQIDIYINGME